MEGGKGGRMKGEEKEEREGRTDGGELKERGTSKEMEKGKLNRKKDWGKEGEGKKEIKDTK